MDRKFSIHLKLYYQILDPQFIIFQLCKIGKDVINCAIKYVQGICGDALDNLLGEHHNVCCIIS